MPPRLNVPPLTRGLIVALVSLSFLNGLLRYREYLAISAEKANVVKYGSIVSEPYLVIFPKYSYLYPWVLLTATFVEQNILGLVLSGVTIFFGGRYLERAWSSAEFAKFVLFTATIPNLLSFVIYMILAASISDHNPIINGTPALQSALLVSFKQLVPEHTVSLFRNLLRIRVKHFPVLHLLFHLATALILGTHTSLILALFGFLTSWTYLRFYKTSPSLTDSSTNATAIKGDASDTFAFAYFFPEPLHTPVAKVADAVYEGLVAVRICTPFSTEDIESHNEQASARAEGGLPSIMYPARGGRNLGGSRAEAERRRALALKALDQRLQAGGVAAGGTGGGTPKTPGGVRTPGLGATPSVQTPSLGTQGQATAAGLGETTYVPEEQSGSKGEEKQAQE
ncbi:MAG: hypothetical protein Q9165_005918 [Trypethelium subeluteriae]